MGNSGRFPPLKRAKTSSIPALSPILEEALRKTDEVEKYHDRRIPKRLDRLENAVEGREPFAEDEPVTGVHEMPLPQGT